MEKIHILYFDIDIVMMIILCCPNVPVSQCATHYSVNSQAKPHKEKFLSHQTEARQGFLQTLLFRLS